MRISPIQAVALALIGGAMTLWAAAAAYQAPEPGSLARPDADNLRELVERYTVDRGSLERFYDVPDSPATYRTMRQFYTAWQSALEGMDFDRLELDARIDWILLRNQLEREQERLERGRKRLDEIADVAPFAAAIIELKDARQRVDPLDPAKAASALARMEGDISELSRRVNERKVSRTAAYRAARRIESLRQMLEQWFRFYNGYDPLFTWWVAQPYKQVNASLEKYAALVREKLAGIGKEDRDTIVGDPIGRQALVRELTFEMIPYTPEQLLALADREFAWCETEMRKASRELGCGDDWKRALERVKNDYAPPGQQPALILKQAAEAIRYVEQHDLVTVPPLARDTWRVEMMTPERQRINPFFTGGEVISISYPTDGMSHEQKLMSMRGNNIHFSRATVFHELIPGHYLQRFMNQRYRAYRRPFTTPFWVEGWSLYWEMLLWDLGFPESPENRIGMLFWRMHRAARIVFSLSFHLQKMTAPECVDYLVNRVGHERENAAAEVRRSFETDYAPLYQAAYMLGGLQLRALHKELVDSGRMSNRQFHDAILKLNAMPIEMVRASLLGEKPARNFSSTWRFYGDL